MKQLTVISGKGGTGKTSLLASLAALARRAVIVDADVDAADLHLLLQPRIRRREPFVASRVAQIDPERCDGCNRCVEACRFSAIAGFRVDPISCEGCGVCFHVCPKGAVSLKEVQSGEWFLSETRFGPLVHARLGVAQENSGKLVTLVRNEARRLAKEEGYPLILIDGPPGIGCPVIAALGGVDAALVVTEPSLSGIHDLKRVLEVCGHFQVPAWVCVNKWNLNPGNTRRIEDYCRERGLPVMEKIPFDPVFTRAMISGQTIPEYCRGEISGIVEKIWMRVQSLIALPPEEGRSWSEDLPAVPIS